MVEETFGLAWNSFHSHLAYTFCDLLTTNTFSDVTLVTDDQKHFNAHKFVLSACSPFFKNILLSNPHPNPLLYLRGVSKHDLECILQFMYLGETRINYDSVDIFLKLQGTSSLKNLLRKLCLLMKSWKITICLMIQ